VLRTLLQEQERQTQAQLEVLRQIEKKGWSAGCFSWTMRNLERWM